jgi:hypothetical protein
VVVSARSGERLDSKGPSRSAGRLQERFSAGLDRATQRERDPRDSDPGHYVATNYHSKCWICHGPTVVRTHRRDRHASWSNLLPRERAASANGHAERWQRLEQPERQRGHDDADFDVLVLGFMGRSHPTTFAVVWIVAVWVRLNRGTLALFQAAGLAPTSTVAPWWVKGGFRIGLVLVDVRTEDGSLQAAGPTLRLLSRGGLLVCKFGVMSCSSDICYRSFAGGLKSSKIDVVL